MSSNVFYKFNSQRDPSRVTFDGTSISVWELKRDIITQSHLGDGTDFDLFIYNPDTDEEYDDDTTQISRSSSVLAKRRPPARPGQGRAARYLTGKMPTTAKASHRADPPTSFLGGDLKPVVANAVKIDSAMTEEEKIAAMFKAGEAQWEQQKAQMAGATPVHRSGPVKRPNASVPENPPPPGYVCHRCRQKGHWIQACPTNNDPNYDNGPRVKRTTGIPRSFLRTVKEDPETASDSNTDEKKIPSNIMINAEGQRVEAVPDMASWEQYKAKAEASAAKKDDSAADSKELEERGLACPIDKRLIVDPMKTPCCGRTYCNDCIENALVNSDLVCPGCESEGVLFDNLTQDEDTIKKIKEYQDEKASKAKSAENERAKQSPPPSSSSHNEAKNSASPTPVTNSKKRAAEDDLLNDRQKTKSPPSGTPQSPTHNSANPSNNDVSSLHDKLTAKPIPMGPKSDQDFVQQMNELAKQHGADNMMNNMPGFPPFAMPNMNMGMGMNMNMNMMGMPNMMMPNAMNPFAMGMMPPMSNTFPSNNNSNNNNQNPHPNGMGGGGNNGMGGGGNSGWNGGGPPPPTGPKAYRNQFSHQQRGSDDEAYMRKPLNPNRAAAQRNRRVRPVDYKELGA